MYGNWIQFNDDRKLNYLTIKYVNSNVTKECRVSSVNCNEAPFIVVLICLALPTQITGGMAMWTVLCRCWYCCCCCYKCTSAMQSLKRNVLFVHRLMPLLFYLVVSAAFFFFIVVSSLFVVIVWQWIVHLQLILFSMMSFSFCLFIDWLIELRWLKVKWIGYVYVLLVNFVCV